MRICDLTLDDIRSGRVWRLSADDRPEGEPLEELGPLEECEAFELEDSAVYAGLMTYPGGPARAIVLIRCVGDIGYGGDYCEFVDGRWRQLGLVPDPDSPFTDEYIGNPLSNDPSFESPSHDERERQRHGFALRVHDIR